MKARLSMGPLVAVLLVELLLLPLVYMSTYYFLLTGMSVEFLDGLGGDVFELSYGPDYHLDALAPALYPAHCIDRQLRPEYWLPEEGGSWYHEIVVESAEE